VDQIQTDSPLVSIVIPAYNGAKYLRDAIDSILKQDYPHIELIVLDDGSSDNTRQILEQYDKVFYWESHPNMGQSATLNKGWGLARGEILAYLSVDDLLAPQAVAQAVQALMHHPRSPVVYGDYDLIDESGTRNRHVSAPDFDYHRLIAKHEVQPGPGAFFRREAFEFTGGWNPSLRQTPDFDFWLKVGLLGNFIHLHEPWASFRVHSDSQSYAEASPEKADEYIRVIEAFYAREDLPVDVIALKSRALATTHAVCARAHIRSGRNQEALEHLRKATACDWRVLFRPRVWKMVLSGVRYRLGRPGAAA
jgi:glycosyltransferase involved in cell wall biosynthesis